MTSIPIRRPLGCLKTTLRQSRQQHRGYANAILKEPQQIPPVPPTPMPKVYGLVNKTHRVKPGSPLYRTGFAVYTTPKTTLGNLPLTHAHLKRPFPTPVQAHHDYQIRKMDPSGARTRLFAKDNKDAARVGDVLMVSAKRSAEPFSGVLMCIRRRGIETAILLRGQLSRVGVEMWFKVYSRNVTGIEIIKRAAKRARRAKLTYLRHPKHDQGSVEHLVREWKRTRMNYAARVAGGKNKKKLRTTNF